MRPKVKTAKERFTEDAAKYVNSLRKADDLFAFSIAVWRATKQGDGLGFDEVETIIKDVFESAETYE